METRSGRLGAGLKGMRRTGLEDHRAADDLTPRLDELAAGLSDPDCDLDHLAEIKEELAAAGRGI
ncbi:hypothetical protein ACFYYB_27690 [Streptomyces sp. NPDC002886]|uniref:hypothetical protein n=1 Tax=Streptomyces sp. NPDC002886 TaxID=3364667 RepID=UPI0036D06E30